jgi:sulfane dehydrogenase subunit SoxC
MSSISRRRVLVSGSAGIAAMVLPGAAQTQDTTKVQGPTGRDVGARSPFEKPARMAFSPARTATFTPLQDLDGIITPADLHF